MRAETHVSKSWESIVEIVLALPTWFLAIMLAAIENGAS
jgi:ABC-type dipeptide/oligopeptide/nickel transport system permease subunit